jgi:dTDP-4-amino-4,6-dideoxygalactose transaminase
MMENELALFEGKPVRTEPFPVWPRYGKEEEQSLLEVLRSSVWGGYNPKVQEFEEAFAKLHGVRHAITCSNGTTALEVALRVVGVMCGDEVIVPAITFISDATAALLCHGVPVFVDIDPKTLNISPAAVEAAISPKTRAIIAVHFGGHPADMDALTAIARRHGVPLIEDASHAQGAAWLGTPVGNFGDLATFSFQAFKLMTSGEGGAIITNSSALAEKVRSYCNQGRRIGGGWFEHVTLGTNYRMTGFQAALLLAQMERLAEQTQVRCANVKYFRERLREVPGLTVAEDDARVTKQTKYAVTLRYRQEEFAGIERDLFIRAVEAEGIPVKKTYPYPLYRNAVFASRALPPCGCGNWKSPQVYESLNLPESERVCRDGIWIEQHVFLGEQKDMDDIIASFKKVHRNADALRRLQQGASAPARA